MANLMPTYIRQEVRDVLTAAAGTSDSPPYLTAYQILSRLPQAVRDRLIKERTIGGAGSGVSYAAPSVVSDAAEMLPGIEIRYIHAGDLRIHIADQVVVPGYAVVGIYRLLEK